MDNPRRRKGPSKLGFCMYDTWILWAPTKQMALNIRCTKLVPRRPLCYVEPSGVQALKNPNPLKDVEAFVVLVVAVLFS